MITRPLDLERALERPSKHAPFMPFVDVLVLIMAFSLFGSALVTSPSMALDLDLPTGDEIPEGQMQWSQRGHDEVVSLITLEQIFFRGQTLTLAEFGEVLTEWREGRQEAVLLLRLDRHLSLADQVKVLDSIRQAGVGKVLVATQQERLREGGRLFPGPPMEGN